MTLTLCRCGALSGADLQKYIDPDSDDDEYGRPRQVPKDRDRIFTPMFELMKTAGKYNHAVTFPECGSELLKPETHDELIEISAEELRKHIIKDRIG